MAITRVPITAARAVAVNTEPVGIPGSAEKMPGLTAKIYDIVRKVVIPARISVLTELTFGSKPKAFCIKLLIVNKKNKKTFPYPAHTHQLAGWIRKDDSICFKLLY